MAPVYKLLSQKSCQQFPDDLSRKPPHQLAKKAANPPPFVQPRIPSTRNAGKVVFCIGIKNLWQALKSEEGATLKLKSWFKP